MVKRSNVKRSNVKRSNVKRSKVKRNRYKYYGGEDDNIDQIQQDEVNMYDDNYKKLNDTNYANDSSDICEGCDIIKGINEIYLKRVQEIQEQKQDIKNWEDIQINDFYDNKILSQLDMTKNNAGELIRLTSNYDFYHFMAYNLASFKNANSHTIDLLKHKNQSGTDIKRNNITLNGSDFKKDLNIDARDTDIDVVDKFNKYLYDNLSQYGITKEQLCLINLFTTQAITQPGLKIGVTLIFPDLYIDPIRYPARIKHTPKFDDPMPNQSNEEYLFDITFNDKIKKISVSSSYNIFIADYETHDYMLCVGKLTYSIECDLSVPDFSTYNDYQVYVRFVQNNNIKDINRILSLDLPAFKYFTIEYMLPPVKKNLIFSSKPNLNMTAIEVDNLLEQAIDAGKEEPKPNVRELSESEEAKGEGMFSKNKAKIGIGALGALSTTIAGVLLGTGVIPVGGKRKTYKKCRYQKRTKRKRLRK